MAEQLRYPKGSPLPWLHLGATTLTGLAIVIASAAVLAIEGVGLSELLFALALIVLGSGIEWRVHRNAMHEPRAIFGRLFYRHATVHHGAFPAQRMAMRGMRDLSIVLLKPWFVIGVALVSLPPAIVFELFGLRSFAAISIIIPSGYVLSYELIHLACHSRPMWITARGPLAWLKRHHTRHHDPEGPPSNFNVALPLWDVLRGSRARDVS